MGARSDDRAVPLPQVLDCLPGPAVLIGADYRIAAANQAYREQYASGKEVIGRRCFEVSHRYAAPCDEAGETCPIALSRESGQPARARSATIAASSPNLGCPGSGARSGRRGKGPWSVSSFSAWQTRPRLRLPASRRPAASG